MINFVWNNQTVIAYEIKTRITDSYICFIRHNLRPIEFREKTNKFQRATYGTKPSMRKVGI